MSEPSRGVKRRNDHSEPNDSTIPDKPDGGGIRGREPFRPVAKGAAPESGNLPGRPLRLAELREFVTDLQSKTGTLSAESTLRDCDRFRERARERYEAENDFHRRDLVRAFMLHELRKAEDGAMVDAEASVNMTLGIGDEFGRAELRPRITGPSLDPGLEAILDKVGASDSFKLALAVARMGGER